MVRIATTSLMSIVKPQYFCTICDTKFSAKRTQKLHLENIHGVTPNRNSDREPFTPITEDTREAIKFRHKAQCRYQLKVRLARNQITAEEKVVSVVDNPHLTSTEKYRQLARLEAAAFNQIHQMFSRYYFKHIQHGTARVMNTSSAGVPQDQPGCAPSHPPVEPPPRPTYWRPISFSE